MTLRELLTARVVLAVCIAVYYWCWARNGWANYFVSIQNCVAIFAVLFFCFLFAVLRFTVSAEIIGYLLMGIFVVMTVLREILFCTMDAKGV